MFQKRFAVKTSMWQSTILILVEIITLIIRNQTALIEYMQKWLIQKCFYLSGNYILLKAEKTYLCYG